MAHQRILQGGIAVPERFAARRGGTGVDRERVEALPVAVVERDVRRPLQGVELRRRQTAGEVALPLLESLYLGVLVGIVLEDQLVELGPAPPVAGVGVEL